jgi:feruloyl esterase
MSYRQMEPALKDGYAVAGSDTGHSGEDLKFAVGHPQKIDDWGHRAVHVMTETAKLVVRAYYGRLPAHAYFSGCSTGGHQALMEAQRYPADYDGIVAGAPGNNRVRLNVGFLWNWMALHADAASDLPASKLPALAKAVMDACDALDGVRDGVIGDPRACKFDPASLVCKGSDRADCLTETQAKAVRKIYDGARNPRTGEQLFTGWTRGSEAPTGGPIGGWSGYFVGKPEPARTDFWRYWVFGDPAWDPRAFDFDRDVAYADKKLAAIVAVDPDLSAFKKRGGKLVMYHGWADPVAPTGDSLRYYESVAHAMGGFDATASFYRFFLAPGMAHCGGGPGPNTFDALGTLDRWVTQGAAPDRIVASHSTDGKVDRTRPLCPYPQLARWKGTGNTDDAASFVCASAR